MCLCRWTSYRSDQSGDLHFAACGMAQGVQQWEASGECRFRADNSFRLRARCVGHDSVCPGHACDTSGQQLWLWGRLMESSARTWR